MRRNIARRTLQFFSMATLCLSMVETARAQGPACTLALTAGRWSFSSSGTVVGVGPRAVVGIFALDADGDLTNGKATSSLNGTIFHETFSGTYTVNPDCTGTIDINVYDPSANPLYTIKADLVFDDNVRQIRIIYTSAVVVNGPSLAIVINGEGRKQFPPSSNQQ